MLDDAQRLGVELIHAHAELGEVRLHRGERVIDVTAAQDGGSLVRVALRLADGDAAKLVPVLFIGSPGHGVACVEHADIETDEVVGRCRLVLVRLTRRAAPQLRQMLLDGQVHRDPSRRATALRRAGQP